MDEKAIKELAIVIAKESATQDDRDNSWWGHDTDIGDLPSRIESHLKLTISQTKKALIEEIIIIRNELYDDLPTANVDAFELIKLIKSHIAKLDNIK